MNTRRRFLSTLLVTGGVAGCTTTEDPADGVDDDAARPGDGESDVLDVDDTGSRDDGGGSEPENKQDEKSHTDDDPDSIEPTVELDFVEVADTRTLVGEVTELNGINEVVVTFEYREVAEDPHTNGWMVSTDVTTGEDRFEIELDESLFDGLMYEIRVKAVANGIDVYSDTYQIEISQFTAPEVRFVVAEDGSGDYESLSDAHRVAAEGDAIGIRSGTYSLKLEKELTLVGLEEDSPPTVNLKPIDGISSVTGQERYYVQSDCQFFNVDVDVERVGDHIRVSHERDVRIVARDCTIRCAIDQEDRLNSDLKLVGRDSTYAESINIIDDGLGKDKLGTIDAVRCEFDRFVAASYFHGIDCEIEADLRVDYGTSLLRCIVMGESHAPTSWQSDFDANLSSFFGTVTSSGRFAPRNCTFHEAVRLSYRYNCQSCEIHGFEALGSGLSGASHETEVHDCTIYPNADLPAPVTVRDRNRVNGPDLFESRIVSDGVAMTITDERSMPSSRRKYFTIGHCVIEGQCELTTSYTTIYATTFTGLRDGYYIDGDVDKLWVNAFLDGGDVRIDNEASVFSEEDKLGNYYSVFDGEDSDGDGILDLPRPIEGNGAVTDQYPLAESDIYQYIDEDWSPD